MMTRNEFSTQLREQLEQSDAYPAWEEDGVWQKIVATPIAPHKGIRFWIVLLCLPFLAMMNADCSLKITAPQPPAAKKLPLAPVAKLNQVVKKEGYALNPSRSAKSKRRVPVNQTSVESPITPMPAMDSQLIAILIDRNTCIQVETEWLVWNDLKDQYQFLDLFRPTQDSTLSLPPEIKLKTF